MAREIARGDIWLYAFAAPDKRRPVLVITRQALGSSNEHFARRLIRWVGRLGSSRMGEVCRALAIATGCAD